MPTFWRVCAIEHENHQESEVGACENCSGFLESTSFLLCNGCSMRLNQCVWCRGVATRTEEDSE
jgi:hypothetical protein